MSISLSDFANGDTDYVSKLNTNNTTLEGAINALQTSVGGAANSGLSLASLYKALFGATTKRISSTSCTAAIASQTVTLSTGYVWLHNSGTIATVASATSWNLAGLADGTWYLSIDSTGAISSPTTTDVSSQSLYSVSKSGTTLSSLAAVAGITWGDVEWQAARSSASLGSFETLDARLESAETRTRTVAMGIYFPGAPTSSQIMARIAIARAYTLPTSWTGAVSKARLAATGQTDIDVQQNGSSIGTIRWAASGTTATYVSVTAATLAAGDVLSFHGPATPDATLGDISITLLGTVAAG